MKSFKEFIEEATGGMSASFSKNGSTIKTLHKGPIPITAITHNGSTTLHHGTTQVASVTNGVPSNIHVDYQQHADHLQAAADAHNDAVIAYTK